MINMNSKFKKIKLLEERGRLNMKKIWLSLCVLLLVSCGKSLEKIAIDYVETGKVETITIAYFQELIVSKKNFVSYITLDSLADCGCSDSEKVIKEYAANNHLIINRISLSLLVQETFIQDYNHLREITKEDAEYMIPELGIKDGNPTIPVLPWLMVYSEGYVAINTNSGFKSKLDKYIEVKTAISV